MSDQQVWVFNGPRPSFPSGIFSTRQIAERWIIENKLTGTLTAYPLDHGVYEWAIAKGYFCPTREDQRAPQFIEKFSSASQEHYHYENGALG